MNSVSDIYLFSSLSFSVYYVLKSRMCNLTFILNLYSLLVLFYPPVKRLCCEPRYWANIIHRFDDQNSLTSKFIENWALFERLTHSQRSALGNLRTTTKFTTTTSVDWEKTGSRTSVSAGKRKLKGTVSRLCARVSLICFFFKRQ